MDRTRGVLIGLSSVIAVCAAMLHWVHHKSFSPMDFIERHLGFSPDDGDGSMEVMLLTALFMIIAAVGFRLAFK
jgi:hypothetical protein